MDIKDLELRNLQVRRNINCVCGEELSTQNVVPPIEINKDFRFYGGRAEKYAIIKCSCGKEYIGLIDANFKLFDTIDDFVDNTEMVEEDIIEETENVEYDKKMTLEEYEETKKIIAEAVEESPVVKEVLEEITGIPEANIDNEGYVCPKCGKVCKNQKGLQAHCKSCVNS